jgi:hypothetical protein
MKRKDVRRVLVGFAVIGVLLFALVQARSWFDPKAPSERSFVRAVRGADRVRVRTGGTCHRNLADEKTIFEEKDPATIARVIASLRIDAAKSGHHCMCCGGPSIEFYRGDELLVTLGCHHGNALRWVEGWRGDGVMTTDSAAELNGWLRANGVL